MALESFRQAARDIAFNTERRRAKPGEINAYRVHNTSQMLSLRAEAESTDGLSELLALGVINDCIVKLRIAAKFPKDDARIRMKAITNDLNVGYGFST